MTRGAMICPYMYFSVAVSGQADRAARTAVGPLADEARTGINCQHATQSDQGAGNKANERRLRNDAAAVLAGLQNGTTSMLLFVGHPRSGHSLVGALLDAHPRAVVANEYNILRRLLKPRSKSVSTIEDIVHGLLQNSRQCSSNRIQAGYNYSLGGDQGRWVLPLRVIGDKKGGDTARLMTTDFEASMDALLALRGSWAFKYKFIRVIRNPFDQIASNFARAWANTRPGQHSQQVAFSSARFRAAAAAGELDMLNTSMSDLKKYGSLSRNLIGRIVQFFSLFVSSENLHRFCQNSNTASPLANADWLDLQYDELQRQPEVKVKQLCNFALQAKPKHDTDLDVCTRTHYVARAARAISRTASSPAQVFHWPSNVVDELRRCIQNYGGVLAPYVNFSVPRGPPILYDLQGWSEQSHLPCLFAPSVAERIFPR